MRRWLLELHLYLGLFCLPCALVLAVSSVLLNHGVSASTKETWTADVGPLAAGAPGEQAEAVTAALGVHGSVVREGAKRSPEGELTFRVQRPGRRYDVRVSAEGRATVAERDGGVVGVLRELHTMTPDRGTRWARSWSLYTEATALGVLLLVASGLARLALLQRAHALEIGLGAAGFVSCVALAAWVW